MLASFSRMAPELYRFSSTPNLDVLFDESVRNVHTNNKRKLMHRDTSEPHSSSSSVWTSQTTRRSKLSYLWGDGDADDEDVDRYLDGGDDEYEHLFPRDECAFEDVRGLEELF
jgi:hypothetical protein